MMESIKYNKTEGGLIIRKLCTLAVFKHENIACRQLDV